MRERVVYAETYRPGRAKLIEQKLPILKHLTDGCKVVECEIRKAGVVMRGDKRLEFHDLRVYVDEDI